MKKFLKRVNGWAVLFWAFSIYISLSQYTAGDSILARVIQFGISLITIAAIYWLGQLSAEREVEIKALPEDERQDFWNWH